MKFNHEENDVIKALGFSSKEEAEHLVTAAILNLGETPLTDKEKVAVLMFAINGNSQMLSVILEDILGRVGSIGSVSKVVEYLYNTLSDESCFSLLAIDKKSH